MCAHRMHTKYTWRTHTKLGLYDLRVEVVSMRDVRLHEYSRYVETRKDIISTTFVSVVLHTIKGRIKWSSTEPSVSSGG